MRNSAQKGFRTLATATNKMNIERNSQKRDIDGKE